MDTGRTEARFTRSDALALAAGCVLSIIGAAAVLRQRFEEIEGGELDAAAEY